MQIRAIYILGISPPEVEAERPHRPVSQPVIGYDVWFLVEGVIPVWT